MHKIFHVLDYIFPWFSSFGKKKFTWNWVHACFAIFYPVVRSLSWFLGRKEYFQRDTSGVCDTFVCLSMMWHTRQPPECVPVYDTFHSMVFRLFFLLQKEQNLLLLEQGLQIPTFSQFSLSQYPYLHFFP